MDLANLFVGVPFMNNQETIYIIGIFSIILFVGFAMSIIKF